MDDYKFRGELLASLDTRGRFEYAIHRGDLEDEYLAELIENALEMRARIVHNKETMKERAKARERRIQMLDDPERATIAPGAEAFKRAIVLPSRPQHFLLASPFYHHITNN